MHQIRLHPGLHSAPHWGAYSTPPHPVAGGRRLAAPPQELTQGGWAVGPHMQILCATRIITYKITKMGTHFGVWLANNQNVGT